MTATVTTSRLIALLVENERLQIEVRRLEAELAEARRALELYTWSRRV